MFIGRAGTTKFYFSRPGPRFPELVDLILDSRSRVWCPLCFVLADENMPRVVLIFWRISRSLAGVGIGAGRVV